jgi:FkbM family methyltransferase
VTEPRHGKLIGGVWLPETETHFVDMMLRNRKGVRVVGGKHTYQYHKLEAALRHQPADRRRVCLDIGGHVGLWAMWLIEAFDVVHAFEPVPAHAALFERTVDLCKARLHRLALGRASGSVSIAVPLEQTGGAHVATGRDNPGARYNPGGASETWHGVPMVTLDSLDLEYVDFIKIDVEGFELPVIDGGRETIGRWRPNIVIEQKGNEAAYGEPRDAAVARLKSWGMKDLDVIAGDHNMGW